MSGSLMASSGGLTGTVTAPIGVGGMGQDVTSAPMDWQQFAADEGAEQMPGGAAFTRGGAALGLGGPQDSFYAGVGASGASMVIDQEWAGFAAGGSTLSLVGLDGLSGLELGRAELLARYGSQVAMTAPTPRVIPSAIDPAVVGVPRRGSPPRDPRVQAVGGGRSTPPLPPLASSFRQQSQQAPSTDEEWLRHLEDSRDPPESASVAAEDSAATGGVRGPASELGPGGGDGGGVAKLSKPFKVKFKVQTAAAAAASPSLTEADAAPKKLVLKIKPKGDKT